MAVYKNVASQKIAVYAHDTAADAPKTGDAANITAQISKDGAATAATDDTNPAELDAADAPGIYLFDMTQAETNCDLLILCAVSSTSDISLEPVIIYTLPGDNAGVDVEVVTKTGFSLAADQSAVTIGTVTSNSDLVTAAAVRAEMDSNSTQLAAIVADTNELQTDDVPGLIAALNDLSAADVAGELATYDAPTKAELDAAVAPIATSAEITALNDPDAATIADAVLDEALAGHVVAGSLGKAVADIEADTSELQANQGAWETATGFSTHSAADVRTEIDANSTQLAAIVADTNELQTDDVPGLIAALNDISTADVAGELATYDAPTKAELDSGLAGLNDPDAGTIAAAILDRALAGHSVAGSVGKAISDIEVDTSELQTNQANWATADVSGLATSVEIAALNDLSSADVATELATYDAPTKAELDSGLAALNDPTAAEIRAEIDANSTQLAAILADTNELQLDDVPSLIAALNDPSVSEIWTGITSAAMTAIADAVLSRGVANVEDSAEAASMAESILAKFESVINTTTGAWTIYKTDHSTTFSTRTATLDDNGAITEVT